MLNRKKVLAPEPYFSAAMEVLYRVLISIRAMTANPEKVTSEQIRTINALVNAVHNIPESLLEHGWFDEKRIREAFAHTDATHKDKDAIGMVALLDECIKQVKKRDESAV